MPAELSSEISNTSPITPPAHDSPTARTTVSNPGSIMDRIRGMFARDGRQGNADSKKDIEAHWGKDDRLVRLARATGSHVMAIAKEIGNTDPGVIQSIAKSIALESDNLTADWSGAVSDARCIAPGSFVNLEIDGSYHQFLNSDTDGVRVVVNYRQLNGDSPSRDNSRLTYSRVPGTDVVSVVVVENIMSEQRYATMSYGRHPVPGADPVEGWKITYQNGDGQQVGYYTKSGERILPNPTISIR